MRRSKGNIKPLWNDIALCFCYDAFAMGIFAAFIIFSMKIPYPVVGSLIMTWVTAPMSLPSWMIGEPDRCVVNKGQQNLKNIISHFHILIESFSHILAELNLFFS